MITEDINTDQCLMELESKLKKKEIWRDIILTKEWVANIDNIAGVYVLKEKSNDKVVYVGETGNLRERMKELFDSRHHTIRRNIGEKKFSKEKGFEKATTKKKFPEHIECLVKQYIEEELLIAILKVPLGRKELEESIEEKIDPEYKLNKRSKRKTK